MRLKGIVKWFANTKGYGFIQTEGSDRDVYVHYTAISGMAYKTLTEGQRVEFDLIEGPRCQQAANVTVCN